MGKRFFFSFVSIILVFLTFNACEIGLGSSVDTEAPEIEITEPANTAVLRDKFTVKGVCSDDAKIGRVEVIVKDVSTKAEVFKTDAVVAEDSKSWYVELNKYDTEKYPKTNGWQLTDGTYQVSVQAFDNGGHHSSEVSYTYDIDNTPPVFALTSPNSTNISDPTNYGTVLSFTGEVADDHPVTEMKIFIFKEDGTLKTSEPLKFTNVETTGGTSVLAAQYQSSDSVLSANYDGIYNTEDGFKGTTQKFYAVITLTDEAGNTSICSYVKDELIKALEGQLGIDSTTAAGLQTVDVKKMMNGTYSIPSGQTATLDNLRETIFNKRVSLYESDSSNSNSRAVLTSGTPSIDRENKKYLAFSLNSNANPTYEIIGYSYDTSASSPTLEQTGSGTSLNVKIQAGLNGYKVLPGIKIKLYATNSSIKKTPDFPYAIIEGSKTTIYNLSTYDAVTKTADVKETKTGTFITNSLGAAVDTLQTNVDTATYTFKLPELSARKAYIVEVEGKDAMDQPLGVSGDKTGYAFQVSASGKAATANFGAADTATSKNLNALAVTNKYTQLNFSGTIKSDTKIAIRTSPNGTDYSHYEVTATNEEDGTVKSWKGDITFPDETVLTDDLNSTTSYNWSIANVIKVGDSEYNAVAESLSSSAGACWLFEVNINFVNGSESVRTLTRSYHIDTKKPTLKITSISPTVANTDAAKPFKINGKVNLTGQVTETNMKELHYYLELTDEAITNVKNKTGIQLDKKVWDNADAYASDKVTYAAYNPETTNLSLNLDIDTNVLVQGILRKKGFTEVSTPTLSYAQNLFDNIESELEFKAYAVDAAGNKSDEVSQSAIFAQQTDKPVISLSNATSGDVTPTSTQNMFGTTSNRNLIGTITDDDGLESVTIKYRKWFKADGTTRNSEGTFTDGNYQITSGTTSTSVNFQLPSEEGEYEVQIYAKDNKNESNFIENTLTYHIAVDAGEPVIKVTTTQNSDASKNNTFTVEGTVSDGASVNVYRYAMATNEKNQDPASSDYNKKNDVGIGDATKLTKTLQPDGSYKWTDSVITGANGDTVTYRAVDKYGFTSDATFTYSIDSVKPVVEVTSIKSNDEIYETNSNYKTSSKFTLSGSTLVLGNTDNTGNFVTITGKWSDTKVDATGEIDGSGTKDLQYSTDNSNWITVGGTSTTYKAGAIWSFDLPVSEGSMNLYVRATDNSGNTSDVVSITGLKVDFAKPQITSQNIDSNISKRTSSEKATSGYYFVQKDEILTFTGTVSDSHGIESITPTFTIDGTDVAVDDYSTKGITFSTTDLSSKPTSATYTITIAGNDSNNGIWTVDVVAKDISERDSTASTKEENSPFEKVGLIVDTVAPAWTTNNSTYPLKVGGSAYDPTKWFNNTSLKFAGFYTEVTSGVDEIYALVVTPSETTAPTSSADVINATGVVSFSAKSNGNFETTLDGLAENSTTTGNKVYFVAKDKAGNISAPASVDVNLDLNAPNFTSNYITYDGTTFFNASGEVLTNALKDITIYGTVSDGASGIAGLTFTVNGSAVSPTVSYSTVEIGTIDETHSFKSWIDENDNKTDSTKQNFSSTISDSKTVKTWKAEISKSSIKSGAVKVTPKDNAGNGTAQQIFSFNADTTPPTVKYTAFTDADTSIAETQINGKVILSGTASDNQQLASVTKIQYQTVSSATTTPSASSWTELPLKVGTSPVLYQVTNGAITTTAATSQFESNTGYTWSSNAIDTEALFSASVSSDVYVYFRVVATDAAGNSSDKTISEGNELPANGTYSALAYVNQNSDRPVIKFNEIKGASGTLRKYTSTITGSITDDDEVQEFKIFATKTSTATPNWSNAASTGTLSWKAGETSFTFEPTDKDDGEIFIFFYVKDKSGKEFTTGGTNKPYVDYKDDKDESQNEIGKLDNTTKISYQTDSNPPVFEKKTFYAGTSAQVTAKTNASDITEEVPSLITVGGTKKTHVKLVVKAHDAIGLSGLTGQLKTTTANPTKVADVTFTPVDGGTTTDKTYVGTLDVSGNTITNGQYKLILTLTDISTLIATSEVTVNVDKVGPEVQNLKPLKTVLHTGDVTVSGETKDNYSAITSLKYIIANNTNKDSDKTALYNLVKDVNTQFNSGVNESFEFIFDGLKYDGDKNEYSGNGTAGTDYWTNPKLPSIKADLDSTYSSFTTDNQIYNIPVYFVAEDELGNISVNKDFYIHYNPYSDRPTTEILYPDPKATENKLSGEVRLSGSAVDNTSVTAVYYQIRPDTDEWKNRTEEGSATKKDVWDGAKEWAESVFGSTSIKVKNDINASANFDADSNFWGIKANGTVSWSVNLNTNGNLQLTEDGKSTQIGTSGTYKIAVRAVSLDNNETLGNWSTPVTFTIDPNSPSIGTVVMPSVEKKNSETATATDTRTVQGTTLYLKDQWYLVTSVSHSTGISEISYTLSNTDNSGSTTSETAVLLVSNSAVAAGKDNNAVLKYWKSDGTEGTDSDKAYTGYLVTIPLNTNTGSGTRTVKIDAKDSTSDKKSGSATYSFKYDNEAPVISNITQNSNTFTSGASLTNSNNQLTLGATVEDSVAGFDKALFYFYRESGTEGSKHTRRIYDPFIGEFKGDNPTENPARIDVTDSSGTDITTGGLTKETLGVTGSTQPLYGVTKTVTKTNGKNNELTFTGDDRHIRVGGAVKINDVYRIIKTKSPATYDSATASSATVTITFSPECTTAFTNAFFPYAQVVDNTGSEKVKSFTSDSIEFKKNNGVTTDDGDGMPESISGMSSSKTWEASIHGNWIPDGAITLVMFAFDASENVSATSIDAIMANNSPRLSKIFLGTNLDGSESSGVATFTDNEFESYSILGKEGASQEIYDLVTENFGKMDGDKYVTSSRNSFKVKDKLAVVPEFVGGNGQIYLVFNNNDTETSPDASGDTVDSHKKGKSNPTSADVSAGYGTLITPTTINGTTVKGRLFVLSDLGSDTAENKTKQMSFTFWDSTDEMVPGESTQYSFLRIKDIDVKQADNVGPKAVIDDFKWNSLNDNSIYGSASASKISDLQGHIELESDWKQTDAYTWYSDSTKTDYYNKPVYDGDPKVSGKISITGSAYDDVRLTELYAFISDFTFENSTGPITSTANIKGAGEATGRTMIKLATYSNGAWTPVSGGMDSYGWNFTVTDGGLDQTGHRVTWKLDWDTSKVTNAAGTNKVIQIASKDKGGNFSLATASTTKVTGTENLDTSEAVYNKPSYQVDVVPYITGVRTALSTLSKKTPTMYSRTALGHYPVRVVTKTTKGVAGSPETVTISGFNIGTNTTLNVSTLTTTDDSTTGGKSAAFSVTVNNVSSLNNINNNNARGSYETAITDNSSYDEKKTYAYNRQPNNANNNLLTDDVYFDVWEFNSAAAVPISGKIEQPVMKIRPTDGKIGFAFVNGPLYFSMGGSSTTENYSYQYWMGSFDFFTSVGFAYDELGHSYGVAAGGDINSSSADKFQFTTSRWGKSNHGQNDSYGSTNSVRLESIGQRNSSGVREFDKQRIKSPSIATTIDGQNTNIYLAYYDSMNDEIRFRAGSTDGSSSVYTYWSVEPILYVDNNSNGYSFAHIKIPDNHSSWWKSGVKVYLCDKDGNTIADTLGDNFQNADGSYTLGTDIGTGQDSWFTFVNSNNKTLQNRSKSFPIGEYTVNEGKRYPNEPRFVKIQRTCTLGNIEDYDIEGDPYFYRNYNVSMIAGSNTNRGAGEYVSIAAIKGNSVTTDVVVAAWYDSNERKLKYAYNDTPLTNRNGTTDGTGWKGVTDVFEVAGSDTIHSFDNAGEYCKIAVDKNGGVHIAAYDPVNLDLVYAYSASATNPSFKTAIVDANGVVGSNLTLDVALVGGKPVPYIGYYATSCIKPKYARFVGDITAASIDGSVDDEVTGLWEISVVPSAETIEMQSNQHNDINIAVWKNPSTGVLINSEDTTHYKTGTSKTTNTGSSYGATSNGQVYGNGTKNAVLGYAVKNGSSGDTIEIAQMK